MTLSHEALVIVPDVKPHPLPETPDDPDIFDVVDDNFQNFFQPFTTQMSDIASSNSNVVKETSTISSYDEGTSTYGSLNWKTLLETKSNDNYSTEITTIESSTDTTQSYETDIKSTTEEVESSGDYISNIDVNIFETTTEMYDFTTFKPTESETVTHNSQQDTDYSILDKLYYIVHRDVKNNLMNINFTKSHFDKLVYKVNNETELKDSFKQYFTKLILKEKNQSDEIYNFENIYNIIVNISAETETTLNENKLFNEEDEMMQDSSENNYNMNEDDEKFWYSREKEMDKGLALPSKQEDPQFINADSEERKKEKTPLSKKEFEKEKGIKTIETPSGRVKILYQVKNNEQAKQKEENPEKNETPRKENTDDFYKETDKNKVSAVMTSDGKIGILVKAKPKENIKMDNNHDKQPSIDENLKTTYLNPVESGKSKVDSDTTLLKPISNNIWTGIRGEPEKTKNQASKSQDTFDEAPYDDEYYDSDDEFKLDDDMINENNNKEIKPFRNVLTSTTVKPITEVFFKSTLINSEKSTEAAVTQKISDNDATKDIPLKPPNQRNDDYRKFYPKSAYLNILDILGPDSRDVIQLLNDVKHNDRPNMKNSNPNIKKLANEDERIDEIPIFNREPAINRNIDRFDEEYFPERNIPIAETTTKMEEIWRDAEEELSEDSPVRIIPMHTNHSVFKHKSSNESTFKKNKNEGFLNVIKKYETNSSNLLLSFCNSLYYLLYFLFCVYYLC